jgi:hypothetical protein
MKIDKIGARQRYRKDTAGISQEYSETTSIKVPTFFSWCGGFRGSTPKPPNFFYFY